MSISTLFGLGEEARICSTPTPRTWRAYLKWEPATTAHHGMHLGYIGEEDNLGRKGDISSS
jgi:hypothetical protein